MNITRMWYTMEVIIITRMWYTMEVINELGAWPQVLNELMSLIINYLEVIIN